MFKKKEAKILMLGLDNAGKTTLLYQLKLGIPLETIPTMGFVHEKIEHENFKLNVWDVAGQDSLRPLWSHYYENTQGLIFVIDSADPDRMELAREELHLVLGHELMFEAAVVLLANKIDMGVMSAKEVEQRMQLERYRTGRKFAVFGTNAISGEGLNEMMDWLVKNLPKSRKRKRRK